jgi:hypothetical protein
LAMLFFPSHHDSRPIPLRPKEARPMNPPQCDDLDDIHFLMAPRKSSPAPRWPDGRPKEGGPCGPRGLHPPASTTASRHGGVGAGEKAFVNPSEGASGPGGYDAIGAARAIGWSKGSGFCPCSGRGGNPPSPVAYGRMTRRRRGRPQTSPFRICGRRPRSGVLRPSIGWMDGRDSS